MRPGPSSRIGTGEPLAPDARKAPWVSSHAVLMAVLVLSYAVLFSWLTVLKHQTWHSTVFDLGIFDQVIWNTARGRFFETSIYGIPATQMGEHFSPILAMFAPLYLVWNDVRLLLIVQSLYMAAGAIPVYLLASRMLNTRTGALLIAAAFLMYPNIAFVNLFDFHPDTLLVLLLPWAFYFLYVGRDLPFLATIGLTILVKEDAALIVFAVGLYTAVVARRRRMGAGLAVFGLAWFIVAIYLVLPYFRGGQAYGHLARFSYLGSTPLAITLNLFSHPVNTLQILFPAGNLYYLFQLLSPLGFFPLLSPWSIVAAPTLLGNLITDFAPQRVINYQYSVSVGPVFFAASVAAVRFLSSRARRFLCESCYAANVRRINMAFAVTIFLFGLYGLGRDNPIGYFLREGSFSPRPNQAVLDQAAALIQPEASLVVSNSLGARFAHRPQLYTPPYPLSPSDYVLADLSDATLGRLEELEKIAPPAEYRTLINSEGIILLQKR